MISLNEERWKDIEGFPNYQVSDQGNVRNVTTGSILRPGLGGVGYLTVVLYNGGTKQTKNVHQLVAQAFLGFQGAGMTVNHIDGVKTNNDLSNLEIITRRDNNIHAYETGLNPHKRPVRIIETGEIFDSVRECANAINGDPGNIVNSIKGVIGPHKGYHFEYLDDRPEANPFLDEYQMDAVNRMFNGCILNGSVGSGKSRVGIYYYFKEHGGSFIDHEYVPMQNPRDLYIITTARKRDTLDFVGELAPFRISPYPDAMIYKDMKVTIDSWNNIKKYSNVYGAFFIFDEDRVTGSGAWVKAFYKIAKKNRWIILSATSGDKWEDYIPVFVANGFYKHKSAFLDEHAVRTNYGGYPQINIKLGTKKLERLRDSILVDLEVSRHTVRHHEDVLVKYDIPKYKDAMRYRWDPYKNEPIQQASGLCYVLRRIVNSDESRQVALLEIFEKHPRIIVFYSFNYERDILRGMYFGEGVEVAEWSGHIHEPIPTGDSWVYLCQYTSACEGFNCITTDTMVFFSQNYSYKVMEQAAGRIDRRNTPYTDLYYYHLRTRSGIDLAITKALMNKKKFNERKYVKW